MSLRFLIPRRKETLLNFMAFAAIVSIGLYVYVGIRPMGVVEKTREAMPDGWWGIGFG